MGDHEEFVQRIVSKILSPDYMVLFHGKRLKTKHLPKYTPFQRHVPSILQCLKSYYSHFKNYEAIDAISRALNALTLSYFFIQIGLEYLGVPPAVCGNGLAVISVCLFPFVIYYRALIDYYRPMEVELEDHREEPDSLLWRPTVTEQELRDLECVFFHDAGYWKYRLCKIFVEKIPLTTWKMLDGEDDLERSPSFLGMLHFFQKSNAEDWWMRKTTHYHLTNVQSKVENVECGVLYEVETILLLNLLRRINGFWGFLIKAWVMMMMKWYNHSKERQRNWEIYKMKMELKIVQRTLVKV